MLTREYLLIATSAGWHQVAHSFAIGLVEKGKAQIVDGKTRVKEGKKFKKLNKDDRKALAEASINNRSRHKKYMHRMLEADTNLMTPNEVRTAEGLPPIGESEFLVVPPIETKDA